MSREERLGWMLAAFIRAAVPEVGSFVVGELGKLVWSRAEKLWPRMYGEYRLAYQEGWALEAGYACGRILMREWPANGQPLTYRAIAEAKG